MTWRRISFDGGEQENPRMWAKAYLKCRATQTWPTVFATLSIMSSELCRARYLVSITKYLASGSGSGKVCEHISIKFATKVLNSNWKRYDIRCIHLTFELMNVIIFNTIHHNYPCTMIIFTSMQILISHIQLHWVSRFDSFERSKYSIYSLFAGFFSLTELLEVIATVAWYLLYSHSHHLNPCCVVSHIFASQIELLCNWSLPQINAKKQK